MATTPPSKPQSADAQQGEQSKKTNDQSAPLLTRKDFGLTVTGRIDSVNEPRHISGTKGDRSYSFHQQTLSLAVNGQMIDVTRRSNDPIIDPMTDDNLDQIVRYNVSNPRTYQGKMSFDIVD